MTQKASHAAKKARLRTKTRVGYAVYLVNKGVAPAEAAKRALVSLPRLRKALGVDKRLEEGNDMSEHLHDAWEDRTRLGEEGVPYHSEEAESLIAARMTQLSASGRPVDRMAIRAELVGQGKIASWSDDRSDFEAELLNSLSPEQRKMQEYSQDFQQKAVSPLGGQTLSESRAIALADHQSKRAQSSGASGVRKLSEGDRREQLIRSWTSQGYTHEDACRRADFALREEARARGEKWDQ
jgi:hypothetical protein